MVMMRPPSATRLAACCSTLKVPRTLTLNTASKSSTGPEAIGNSFMMPALLTTTPIVPCARSASSNSRAVLAASATSACTAIARPPCPPISLTTSAALSAAPA
jgi:hypothetical protein